MENLFCPDATVNLWGLFDTTIAPTLLYYAYLPISIFSVFFGLFIFLKNKKQSQSKLLLLISINFTLLLLNELVTWIAARADLVYLGWELSAFFQTTLVALVVYFTWVYFKKDNLGIKQKISLLVAYIPVLLLLPTRLNTTYFDLSICEPGYGPLWLYIYALEVLAIVFVGILGVHYFKKTTEPDFKKQIAWLSIASVLFLSIFAATNIAGDALALYEVNLIGPIGMVLFIAFLAFMIVRFKAFSIKLLGTQALVTTIFAVTFAILFIRQIENVRYVVIATLVLLAVVGRSLIKSVKREVQAREEIEVLAKNLDTRNTELKISNDNQSTLIHVMNHQIKGYLGMAKNIFAELLLSNDYGQVPEAAKPILKQGLETTDNGVNYVQSILRGASALNGTLPFDMKTVDIKPIVLGLITQQKDVAEKSDFALTFESHVVDGDYNTVGDSIQLTECFKNLITNGIKYNNPHGSLKVDLFQRDGKIIFEVKDSGDGVAEDVKPRLFTAGGMSKDSPKKNKEASGFGLALVKGVADAHRGTVGFRSNAPEKGSTFFIELPIVSSLVK